VVVLPDGEDVAVLVTRSRCRPSFSVLVVVVVGLVEPVVVGLTEPVVGLTPSWWAREERTLPSSKTCSCQDASTMEPSRKRGAWLGEGPGTKARARVDDMMERWMALQMHMVVAVVRIFLFCIRFDSVRV